MITYDDDQDINMTEVTASYWQYDVYIVMYILLIDFKLDKLEKNYMKQ